MRPRHVVDKALQELRADDAAGAAVAGDVLDVGRVAVDRTVVGFGERQPPQLFADRLAGGGQAVGELIVVGEQPGMLAAERDMTAPVRVARSTISFGLKRSWQYHSTSARTSRPSASVFSTSIVCPDIELTMSPGRCAEPEGMFSTSPTMPTALTFAFGREKSH